MSSEVIAIEQRRFGRIEVPAQEAIRFEGLPGFPSATRFALLAHDQTGESAFAWLVCLDVPDLAFVVTDPWQFFPDYDPAIAERELRALGAKAREDVDVFSMVTLRDGAPTLNLLAPLVLCAAARRGMQLILEDARYTTSQPLPALNAKTRAAPEVARSAAASEAQIESKPQR